MNKATCLLILFTGMLSAAQAQQSMTTTTAVPLLNEAPDARSAGMGSTGAATSPDINSQHWNAAKYVFMEEKGGISLTYTPWMRSVTDNANLGYLSGFYQMESGRTFSASLWFNNVGSIQATDESGLLSSEYTANEFAIDFAYSQHLAKNWSAGVALRYINSDLMGGTPNSKVGQTVAADINVYHQKDVTLLGKNSQYAFGVNISNLGGKISYADEGNKYFLPMNLRIGGRLSTALTQDHGLALLLDLNKLMVPVEDHSDYSVVKGLFSSFGDQSFANEMKSIGLSVGLEYSFRDLVAARMGYFTESKQVGQRQYLSFGVGGMFRKVSLDIAYQVSTNATNDALSNIFRFTLGYCIGARDRHTEPRSSDMTSGR